MKKIIIILLILALTGVIFHSHFYRLKPRGDLQILNSHWLRQIAAYSLETDDVPIGTILFYEDEVIGEGHHTVYKDEDPSAHATVNALRDAAKNLGFDNFEKLDRSKLKLITTYEPCEMCKGAIINNDIENVEILMAKGFSRSWDAKMKGFTYEMNKQTVGREYIQDSLFVIHPDYPFVP